MFYFQARHEPSKEIVAIKKMSYSGKQSAEVNVLPCKVISDSI